MDEEMGEACSTAEMMINERIIFARKPEEKRPLQR
jgi:hypothetical protein